MITIFDKPKPKTNPESNEMMGEPISMAGKTPEEMLPFLLSGESDDLPEEFTD